MSDQYYYRNTNGQESGPYDAEECRRMVSVGLIEMGGMVRAVDSESWQPVGSVFPAAAAAPAPPPRQTPRPSPAPAPTPGAQPGQPLCTRTTYILIAILPALAGIVGIHNLIAGYKERGIIQLALSGFCWIMVFLGFIIGITFCLAIPLGLGLFVWAVVEAVQVKVDANNVPMTP